MQRLDQRDEPPCLGELVQIDNLIGIDERDGLFVTGRVYNTLLRKYNPKIIGKIVGIEGKQDVICQQPNKMFKEGEVIASKLPHIRVRWNNGQYNSYYPHNLREV